MKNKRSSTWLKHHGSVVKKESELKKELTDATTSFETQVKRVVVISAVSGLTVLAGYSLYKALTRPGKTEEEQEPEVEVSPNKKRIKVKRAFSWKSVLFERLAMVAVKFIGTQLALFLSTKLGIDEEEGGDEKVKR